MAKGIGACLVAALLTLLTAGVARAGDPAIEEPNGLLGLELGYLRTGSNGGGSIINGEIGMDGQFHQCPGNDCSTMIGRTLLVSSTTSGGKGQLSGFSAFGGGQFALPVGHDFGMQLDGNLGGVAGGAGGGGGGDAIIHVFRGDPAVGLFGPMIDYAALGDAGYLRAGAEGQYYWRDVTLYGSAGYQWADSGTNVTIGSGVVGCGYVAWYPNDSLMLLAGGGGGAGEFGGFGQIEWQPFQRRDPGATLFVEGMTGGDDSLAAFAGFRYHFGAGNSLEMRHWHELPLRDTLCGMEQFVAPSPDTMNVFLTKRE
jgi:hypothetical protein